MEAPEGWSSFTMHDVMAEFYDGPHATPSPAPDGPIFLGIKNLTEDGHLNLSEVRHISEEEYPRWTRRVEPRPRDVVFTYEASLHRYAIIPEGFRGCLGRRIALIRPNDKIVDTTFLFYVFLSPIWRATVTQRINVGSTVDRIPLIEFPSFPIALPDLKLQKKIAKVLSAYDDSIENNLKRIQMLEETAHLIYREWFVKFRYPGHEDVSFIDSGLGPIPERWEVKSLGELVSVDKGLSYQGAYLTDDGTPMANLKCFRPGGGFRRDGTKPYSGEFKSKHVVRPGDVIVANTDLTQAGNVIGSPAVVPRRGFADGGIISHHLFAVRPGDSGLDRTHLYHLLSDDRFRSFARGVASGTTVLGLRAADFLAYEIPVPGTDVLGQFHQIAGNLMQLAEILEDANDNLCSTRDLLLPALISGEVDVSELDINVWEGAV